jgi:hypothetical protein
MTVDERVEDGHTSVAFFKQIGPAEFERFVGDSAAPPAKAVPINPAPIIPMVIAFSRA